MNEFRDERILIFARGRDGDLTLEVLGKAGLTCGVAASAEDLCRELEAGAGVLILGEEMLARDGGARIVDCLSGQPPWSDLPVIVVAGNSGTAGRASRALDALGNVSVLPRPLPIDTLVTAVRSGLRARRRQYQVRNLLRDREEADRRKDEFLAMLAHELRNPLAPIRNAAHALRLVGPPDPDLVEMREILDRQVGHMARLVDDLLDVSRISRGMVVLRKQPVDLGKASEQASRAAGPSMESKGIAFRIALPDEPIAIEADPTRLEQIIGNLLNNAAKYTEPGGQVSLTVGREGAVGVLRVRDSGIGIEPGLLPRVFDLFAQADRPLDRTQGGLGVGLTIVKSLVEQHGGTVEVSSDGVGKGTEVVLRFPVAPRPSPPGARPAGDPGPGGRAFRVLVVDDNRDAAAMLARVLKLQGHEARVVHDGPSALDAAPDFRPHVILSDIGLPGLDGYEVAKRLRKEPACRGALLVAVTGYGQKEDASRAEKAGFDHHLTKPLDLDRLDSILASFRPDDLAPATSHGVLAR